MFCQKTQHALPRCLIWGRTRERENTDFHKPCCLLVIRDSVSVWKQTLHSFWLIAGAQRHCLGLWKAIQKPQEWLWVSSVHVTFVPFARACTGWRMPGLLVWYVSGCSRELHIPEWVFTLAFQVRSFYLLSYHPLVHHIVQTVEASCFAAFQVVALGCCAGVKK